MNIIFPTDTEVMVKLKKIGAVADLDCWDSDDAILVSCVNRVVKKLIHETNDHIKCRLCDTWKGAKRYKYCPDCGRKIEREE